MNILITAPSLNPDKNVSGISSVAQNIIEHNKMQTYYHYLLGRPDKAINKFRLIGKLFRQLFYFPLYVKKHKIEIVHQNFPLDPKGVIRESLISFWCRSLRIPVLLHIHGGRFISGETIFFFRFLIKSIFRSSKKVIVLGDQEKEILANKFDYKDALVIPNCIDTSIYYSSNEYKKTGTEPVFLYLGRIEKNKGINELIEALKLLRKDHKFQFYLCGDGPMRDFLIESMKIELADNFKYFGVVSGQEKIDTIKKSTYFLLPSYFEGLPMALLETMAAGVIPIITNVGSMGKVVTNGFNGFFFQEKNVPDLLQKMKYVMEHPHNLATISDNAKKTIQNKYDIKHYINELNNIYNSIITNT